MGITVGVHAAYDGQKLDFTGEVSTVSQPSTQVKGVDPAVVVPINAAVGGKARVVIADLKFALQDVEAALQVDLLLENVKDGSLDVIGQAIEATNTEGGTIQSDITEQVVGAG